MKGKAKNTKKTAVVKVKTPTPKPVEEKKEENSTTIVIRRGDIEITLTNVTSEIAIETIKAVMN